jgi:Mrp family chromosome partitioning ATPase
MAQQLAGVQRLIAVASGKGGVGKTTVTVKIRWMLSSLSWLFSPDTPIGTRALTLTSLRVLTALLTAEDLSEHDPPASKAKHRAAGSMTD